MTSTIIIALLYVFKYLALIWIYVVRTFLSIRYAGQKQVVPPVKNELLLMSATKMAEQIRKGKVKSLTFVSSYIERFHQVNPFINAIAEERFEQALEEAKSVDSLIASQAKTIEQIAKETPLLGVPITIKLSIQIAGMLSTSSSKYFADRVAEDDADAIKLLKEAGAIIIATTSTPEFCLSIDTANKLYGSTKNPYDTTKTSGGSSGGESASISSACSILGVGSDLGGSVRIPAAFCGIFAHKPTMGIVSSKGHTPSVSTNSLTLGPMCRYAEDLLTSMKVLAASKRSDMKLDDSVDLSKINIFYMENPENMLAIPTECDILNKLHQAVAELEKCSGSKAERFQLTLMKYCYILGLIKLRSTMKKSLKETLFGEGNKINVMREVVKNLFGRSEFTTNLLVYLCMDYICEKVFADNTDVAEKQLKKMEKNINSVLDENSVLLMPSFPIKSFYHGESMALQFLLGCTALHNILGLPVTQCPLGLDEDKKLPIGIQIVASKGNDRLAIKCAIELEKIFGGWRPPHH